MVCLQLVAAATTMGRPGLNRRHLTKGDSGTCYRLVSHSGASRGDYELNELNEAFCSQSSLAVSGLSHPETCQD